VQSPFCKQILLQVVQIFIAKKIKGFICCPLWSNQSYWPIMYKYADYVIEIPPHSSLFSPAEHHPIRRLKPTRWPINIFYFGSYDIRSPCVKFQDLSLNVVEQPTKESGTQDIHSNSGCEKPNNENDPSSVHSQQLCSP
jgi:hypothetical protein